LALGVLALALAALSPLALAPTAGAKPHVPAANPSVKVGRVVLSAPTGTGGAALLVPVRYPIQFAGRWVRFKVSLWREGKKVYVASVPVRLSAGPVQIGDRRRSFTYVHRVTLNPGRARAVLLGNLRVHAEAGGNVDVNEDGHAELHSVDSTAPLLAIAPARTIGALCSTVPRFGVLPGRTKSLPVPACSRPLTWRIAKQPRSGKAVIEGGRLVYRAPRKQRGAVSLVLRGRPAAGRPGTSSAAGSSRAGEEAGVAAPVALTVGSGPAPAVRAIGDSVTAGFGYYGDGASMPLLSLYECRPGAPYNDACSSNSEVTSAGGSIFEYAPDYGLANNISWAAQWANEYGVTNYENLAVSGSEPKDWAPGGVLYGTTQEVEAENPDYILITIGANPLLSEMLFGAENMGCAIYADVFGEYAKCIEKAFAGVQLQAHLKQLYSELVTKTKATIYLMEYPLTVPSSALAYDATQIAEMGQLLNREITKVAAEVSPARLHPVAPPHFNVGISVEPVYPSHYTCGYFEYPVDGPSVQTEATQDELDVLHHLSFCPGPKPKGPNWVISGDTGIHPSATGYTQMASQIPAPTQG
jgi:lysophospholipase L1-like esterase